MKNTKILRNIIIIISVIVMLMNIGLYIKLRNLFDIVPNLGNSLEIAGVLIGSTFYFGTFIYGIILLVIIWIQYFLILVIMKIFNKLEGIKKWILSGLLGVIVIALMMIIISIIRLILIMY